MAKLTGLQCASFNYYSSSYNFIDHVRVPTKISFFRFPQEQSERNAWCNLIKWRENKDGFRISKSLDCVRSIFSLKKFTDLLDVLGKDWFREPASFIPLEQLYLHWKRNNFTFIERASETISKEESKGVADCSQQLHDVQQDLFETDDNIQLDDSLDCRFWKSNQGSYWLSLKDWNIQLKHAISFYRSR